jgi:hypothetical protein
MYNGRDSNRLLPFRGNECNSTTLGAVVPDYVQGRKMTREYQAEGLLSNPIDVTGLIVTVVL